MSIPRSLNALGQQKSVERPLWAEATPDMLSIETLIGIQKFGEWMGARARAIRELLGGAEPGAPIRDTILREACVCLAKGELHGISHYQHLVSDVASRFAVREEILRLASIGMLVVRHDHDNIRRTIVAPSARLALWYAEVTPILLAEAQRIFS